MIAPCGSRKSGLPYEVFRFKESEFRAGKPRKLFRHDQLRTRVARPQYDVGPDGERFLVVERAIDEEEHPPGMIVVENWFEEFRDHEQD